MTAIDYAGYPASGANAESIETFERASHELRCLIGDPVATVDRAIEQSPRMTMAHVLKGWLHLLGTEPSGVPVAHECAQAADVLPATARERAHIEALRLLADGRWRTAGLVLEDLNAQWPRDALALQVGHQIDFFCGHSRMLRDRIARVLPSWDRSMCGYHALLGMHAFGLEETGDYEQAERQGRHSVELEQRDGWAWHAVAHVMEMRNRPGDGIDWLQSGTASWAPESFLAVHNWWHLALFHLERDDVDAALRLVDGPICGAGSSVVLDLVDASAMLWRLHLRGVDVGDRWSGVADRWETIGAGHYAFNDLHAMMAFVGADRTEAQRSVLEAQRSVLESPRAAIAINADNGDNGDNADFTREIGSAATRAVLAFGDGDYRETIRLLRPVRSYAHRFGGSHAQRDIIDLTLIEAALRGGDPAFASALAAERAALRPSSAPTLRYMTRARQLAATPIETVAIEPGTRVAATPV